MTEGGPGPETVQVTRHEDDGVSWEMARRPAHAAIRPYVGQLCGYREWSAVPLRRREVPRGQVSLIISFGDKVELVEMTNSPTLPGPMTTFVAGFHEGHAIVESSEQAGMQLDITPLGAYRLLGLPMSELANQVVPLDALLGRTADELVEQLATAPDWSRRFDLLDELLLDRVDKGPEPDREVQWAWNQLARSHGRLAVGPLAAETGWSHRHFISRFRQQVGLAPKPTGRVLRFRRAADLLADPALEGTITDVAAACGYADHSHLTREFQSLAGCAPSAFMAAQLPAGFGVES